MNNKSNLRLLHFLSPISSYTPSVLNKTTYTHTPTHTLPYSLEGEVGAVKGDDVWMVEILEGFHL